MPSVLQEFQRRKDSADSSELRKLSELRMNGAVPDWSVFRLSRKLSGEVFLVTQDPRTRIITVATPEGETSITQADWRAFTRRHNPTYVLLSDTAKDSVDAALSTGVSLPTIACHLDRVFGKTSGT